MNSQSWGGYNNWTVPTPQELWKLLEDKTFPFRKGDNWQINGKFQWCVDHKGVLSRKDLDYKGATAGITAYSYVFVILCSDALRPANYSADPRVLHKLFNKYNLIPKFNFEGGANA